MATECHLGLQTIRDTPNDEDLLIGLFILLPIDDVVDHFRGDQTGFERRPLLRRNLTGNVGEVIIGVGGSELHALVHALNLEETVGGEALIELQE